MDLLSQNDFLFTAVTSHINHIYRILKAISVTGKDASITVSDQGLKISVENRSRSCQTHLFLNQSLFSIYKFQPENYLKSNGQDNESETTNSQPLDSSSANHLVATFNISLRALTGCLHTFNNLRDTNSNNSSYGSKSSTNTSSDYHRRKPGFGPNDEIVENNQCLFVYRGPGYPFMIYFNQGLNSSITTKCELETYDLDGSVDVRESLDNSDDDNYAFADTITIDPSTVVQKVILKGKVMGEILKELDSIGTNIVTIRASAKTAPHFTFISHSDLGISQYNFPNDPQILDVFLVAPPGHLYDSLDSLMNNEDYDDSNWIVENSYNFDTLNLVCDTVFLAKKINIRCDSSGVMSIQSLCETEPDCQSYIDFRFLPVEG